MEWQPIETAPRVDGEYLLLWCGWPETGCAVDKPKRGKRDWYSEPAGINPIFHVTHWMPLPPPPLGAEQ